MANIRLIARLDIKGPNLIKGIHLEGFRVVGNPKQYAQQYYEDGIDEIIFMDAVATLYGRNNLKSIIRHTAQHIFIPLTVGGGIRSVEDAREILRNGADKVAINTAAIQRPGLIMEIAQTFGSQCMVLSIEAKRRPTGGWEALTDNGRERTGVDAVEWARKAAELGAGEILLTSVDQEGTAKGFDNDLVRSVSSSVSVPVIASGGMGKIDHLIEVVGAGKADAVAMAKVLHYQTVDLKDMKIKVLAVNIPVRDELMT